MSLPFAACAGGCRTKPGQACAALCTHAGTRAAYIGHGRGGCVTLYLGTYAALPRCLDASTGDVNWKISHFRGAYSSHISGSFGHSKTIWVSRGTFQFGPRRQSPRKLALTKNLMPFSPLPPSTCRKNGHLIIFQQKGGN